MDGNHTFSGGGDVIFMLNNGSRLRVHSVILKSASPIIRAMFGPHFSEGQRLSEKDPREVALPDDHPQAMTIICAVLHHQSDTMAGPTMEVLREIALMVDKYDLLPAIRTTTQVWLNTKAEEARHGCYGLDGAQGLLEAAYLFDNAQAFKSISRDLILFTRESFHDIRDKLHFLSDKALSTLEKTRTKAYQDIAEAAERVVFRWYNGRSGKIDGNFETPESCGQKFIHKFGSNKDSIRQPDPEDNSVAAHLDYWKDSDYPDRVMDQGTFTIRWIDWAENYGFCDVCQNSGELIRNLKNLLHVEMERQSRRINGLCLECVRNGDSCPARGCRLPHKTSDWVEVISDDEIY